MRLVTAIVFVVLMLLIVGCGGQSATFGEGDLKLKVELIESDYLVTDGVGNDVVVQGTLKLKLSNKGEKQIPFVTLEDTIAVVVELQDDDYAALSDQSRMIWDQDLWTIPIQSDEGLIMLSPRTSPTYSFSFRQAQGTDPTQAYDGLLKEYFERATYQLAIGEERFPLNGEIHLGEREESVKESLGLTDEEVKSILNTVGEKARLDECDGSIDEIGCLVLAWQLAFKQHVPQGKEGICDLVKRSEIRPYCKLGVNSELSQLEARFDELTQ